MKRTALYILIIFIICITGCSNANKSTDTNVTNKFLDVSDSTNDKTVADSFINDTAQISLGMFSFGIISESNEKQVYEYNGNELHIPFSVLGLDETVSSDFGLIVFVDGIPQPYKISKKDNEETKEQYMHKFYLKYEEKEEFDIVFTPVTGKKGERVGLVFATILKPDFIPQNEQGANYGFYHYLNANLAHEIYFKCEPLNKKEFLANSLYKEEDIPQAVIDEFSKFRTNDDYNTLDSNFVTELSSQGNETEVFKSNNGKLMLEFRIYGGQEATYRTVFYIDHKPIRIMDADYLEIKTTKEKMCSVEVELDIGSLNKLSTLYAITNPVGKDYLAVNTFPIKTRSSLIINDKQTQEGTQTEIIIEENNMDIDSTNNVSVGECIDYNIMPRQKLNLDFETNSLLLIDNKTNALIRKIDFEENSYAQNIFEFEKGYIVQVNYSETPVKFEKEKYGVFVIFPNEINRCILHVYDEQLNIEKEIDVSSVLPKDLWGEMARSAVSDDGDKIIWAFLQKLYICELSSGKIEMIFDENVNENKVSFSQICFTKDNEGIIFTGSSIITNEGDCVFGLIELDDNKMSYNIEKNYNPNSIRVTARYSCLCDTEKPFVGASSGRVPVLDLLTKKAFTIKVGGSESAHARVSEDGKYLITVQKGTSGNYSIQQYGLPTGKMVNKKNIDVKVGELWNIDTIYSGNASVYYLTGIAKDGKCVCYAFDCEEN